MLSNYNLYRNTSDRLAWLYKSTASNSCHRLPGRSRTKTQDTYHP
ncbi:MAG: hypothetical protein PUP93_05680 [Rhizonema sp. NSF051]|nr:hypothetical protein [Rhizonema sp. NSF051]